MTHTVAKRSVLLLALDMNAIVLAYVLAMHARTDFEGIPVTRFAFLYAALGILPFLFYIFDLYYPYRHFSKSRTFVDVVFSVGIGGVVLAAISYLDRTFTAPRFVFLYTTLLLIPFIFSIRVVYDFLFQSRMLDRRAFIIGTGATAGEIARTIRLTPHPGIELMGLISENRKITIKSRQGIPVVGSLDSLLSLIDWYKIQLVILALDPEEKEISELGLMSEVLRGHVTVTSAIHLFEQINGEIPYRLLGSQYLLGLMAQTKKKPFLRLKYILDVLAGCLLFVLLAPVMLLAMLILSLELGASPLFFQKRIGRYGRPFRLIKLKTMKESKRGKPVVTWMGRWMRRFRIDEIPQLINVVMGDMSLIGPRPEIPYFVARSRKKIPFYDVVFAVKPGLTGWAQVLFRYATSVRDYEQKFRYNLYYLKNISPGLDLQILLKTIRVVLLGKGK